MTTPVFPGLPGQGWSVKKTPRFATLVASHVSGREARAAQYLNPIWDFELTINALDSSPAGMYSGVGAATQQALLGLFLQCQGQFGTFIYYDPTDYSVTNQFFATADGSTTGFQLARSMGNFLEWIVAPVTVASTLYFPGNVSVAAPALSIYVGGALVSASRYSISNGFVTFTGAPGAGFALTWSGCFGFLCRFDDDDLEFEEFMSNLWRVESLKFRSVRAV